MSYKVLLPREKNIGCNVPNSYASKASACSSKLQKLSRYEQIFPSSSVAEPGFEPAVFPNKLVLVEIIVVILPAPFHHWKDLESNLPAELCQLHTEWADAENICYKGCASSAGTVTSNASIQKGTRRLAVGSCGE